MAQTIKLKRSATQNSIPTTSALALGEVAINTYDGKMYIKKSVGGTETVVEVGGSGGGLSSSFTVYEYSATANQTTFSGSDGNSNTLAYDTATPPKILVYLNGVLLDFTTDYTASNGTSIVLTNGAAANDLVQVAAYKSSVSTTLDIDLADNQKVRFGNSQDLQIFHDGTHSYINSSTGSLYARTGNTFQIENQSGSEDLATFAVNGAVTLYYDNSPKIATTSAGIDVTGNIAVSGTVDGVDIAARDAVLTSTTTTAGAALPLAGGTMTGNLILSHASSPTLTLQDTTNTVKLLHYAQNSNAASGTYSAHPYLFYTNSTLALTLDTSQNATFAGNITVTGDGSFNGTKLVGDSKHMISFADTWLRLNPDNHFTSGIYAGTGILRTDGHFQVGSSGAKFSVNGTTGNVTVAGTISSGAISSTGNIAGSNLNIVSTNWLGWGDYGERISGSNTNSSLYFYTDATTALTLDGSQNATFAGTISSGAITSSGLNLTNSVAPYITFTEGSNVVHMGLDGGGFWIRQNGLGGGDEFSVNSDGTINVAHDATFGGDITSSGNVSFGNSGNVSMNSSADGQVEIKGSGYQGAIALDATAMRIYHNSSARSLVLGTNETARMSIDGSGTFDFHERSLTNIGAITTQGVLVLKVSDTDSAHQRVDVRDETNGHSRAHWYGVSDNGTTANFRHAWYDGTNYINVTAASGTVTFGGNITASTITASTFSSGNITTTGYIRGPSTFTIDPAAHGDDTGTVVIAGNLQVDGLTTTINSTTLSVDDLNITVADGAANAAAANGAGLTVDGASATLTYTSAEDRWNFNKKLYVPDNITIAAGAPSLILQDTTDDDDHSIRFMDSGGTNRMSITTLGDDLRFETTGSRNFVFMGDASASGQVLIGSSTSYHSSAQLQIVGGGSTTSSDYARVLLKDADGTNQHAFIDQSMGTFGITAQNGTLDGTIQFSQYDGTTTSTRMIIKPGGNVGIATSTPQSKLDVKLGNNETASIGGTISSGTYAGLRFGYSEPGNTNYRHSAIVFERDDAAFGDARGNIHILNSPSGSTSADLGDARLTILPSGNVGIGTTSPDAKFQVEEAGIDTTTTSTTATTQVAIDTFAAATFRSARYTIQVTNSTDSTYHLTEILLIHNGTTPQITEFGTIFTGSAEATFDADISSGNVRLLATPATTDSMTFKVVRHCITV